MTLGTLNQGAVRESCQWKVNIINAWLHAPIYLHESHCRKEAWQERLLRTFPPAPLSTSGFSLFHSLIIYLGLPTTCPLFPLTCFLVIDFQTELLIKIVEKLITLMEKPLLKLETINSKGRKLMNWVITHILFL